MSKLTSHLEARLGRLKATWNDDPDGIPVPFTVGFFEGGRIEGVSSYSSLGLSKHHLTSRNTGKGTHQELIVCGYPRDGHAPYPQLIQYAGILMEEKGAALLRGDVMRLPGAAALGSQMTALYAASPVYFDTEFFTVETEHSVSVTIVWLVPIGGREADYIRDHGWQQFDDLLVEKDPDVLDLFRSQIC